MKRSAIWFLGFAFAIGIYLFQKYRIAPGLTPATIMIIDPESGAEKPLSDLHEGILLVNFYASWCGPCMKEMPSLQAGSEYAEEVQFIGLTDDPEEKIERVRSKFGIKFPLYKVVDKMGDQGVHTYPTTYIFDGEKELLNYIGPRDWSEQDILDQAAAGKNISTY